MKIGLSHIVGLSLVCATLILLGACLGINAQKRAGTFCTGVEVAVLDSADRSFVTADEIKSYIRRQIGDMKGRSVGDLDLVKVETTVDGLSAVLKSQAYITPNGKLNIDITQREPAIRFETPSGGFYADSEGYIFPLQRNYTSRVTIVDGYIPLDVKPGYKGQVKEGRQREWVGDILRMSKFIEKDKTWNGRIVQMSVLKNGDIVLVPATGKEKFIFGSPGNFEDKFELMEKYYTAVRPYKGEDFYSTVNVKYKGQIICRE